jgi:hypothetical protein
MGGLLERGAPFVPPPAQTLPDDAVLPDYRDNSSAN